MDSPTQNHRSLFRVDLTSKLPLYTQIERNLKDLITHGELTFGQALPSEWELASLYGVSRLTVRRALDELERQNWITRRRGVGTFIRQPFLATIAASKLSFTEQMKAIGRRPSSQLIESAVVPAPPAIAQKLNLPDEAPLFRLTRLRLADEVPILYEIAWLSHERFPALASHRWASNDSLYRLLHETYGVVITGLDHTIKPVLLSPQEAAYFQSEPGLPALVSEIIAFDQHGSAVEFSWSVSNGDKGEFYFRFRQIESDQ